MPRHGSPRPCPTAAASATGAGWRPTGLLFTGLLFTGLLLAPALRAAAPPPVPTFGDSPCVERPAATASGAPAVPSRIASLRYECHVVSGGQPLFVGRAGPADAPVLLLIHGLGQNAHTDWTEPVQSLAREYQLVVVDLPGFGASPSPGGAYSFTTLGQQLAQLVTRLAPGRRVHVVGHSLGGAVALHLAQRHAALVDRLVLVDAAGILLKQVFMRHLTAQAVPATGVTPIDQIVGRIGGRLRDLGSLLFLGRDDRYDITPWLMQNAELRKALFGGVVQADAALTLVEQDFTAALREVTLPTTLIWGEADRIAPLRTGRILAAHLPQARLRVIAGADEEDVALGELDFVLRAAHVLEALVVVVDRHRERALGRILADHVLVEDRLDLGGHRQVRLRGLGRCALGRRLVADDVVAQLDALVADEHRRAGDQLLDFVLALAAEGAVQHLLGGGAFLVGHGWNAWVGGVRAMIVEKPTRPAPWKRPETGLIPQHSGPGFAPLRRARLRGAG